MKVTHILLAAIIIIAIATGLKAGFANGLLTFGIGLIPVAMCYSFEKCLDDDND